MTSVGHRFKELFLACERQDRIIIAWNLARIFRVYYQTADENDLCYCGFKDLWHFAAECSDTELRNSNIWNSFTDGGDSELLRKVVTEGLDMFKVQGEW